MRWGAAAVLAVVSHLGSGALVAEDTVAEDTVALVADARAPAFAPVSARTVVRRVKVGGFSRLAMLSSTTSDDTDDERGLRGRANIDWDALSSATDSDHEWRLHSRADPRVFPEETTGDARRRGQKQWSESDSDHVPKYTGRRGRKQASASDSDDYIPKYTGRRREARLSASDDDYEPDSAPSVAVRRLGVGGDHTGTVLHVRARAVLPPGGFVPKRAAGAPSRRIANPPVVRRTVEPPKLSPAVPNAVAVPSSASSGDELLADNMGSSLVSAARAFQAGGRLDALGKRLALSGGAQTLSSALGLRAPGDRTAVILNDPKVLTKLQAALGLGAAPGALRLDVGVRPDGSLDVSVQAVLPETAPRAAEWLADVSTAALCAPDEFPVLAGTTGAYRLRAGVLEALSEPLPASLVDARGILGLLTGGTSGQLALEDGVSDGDGAALHVHTGGDEIQYRDAALTGRKRRAEDDFAEDAHATKRVMRSIGNGENDQYSTLPTTIAEDVAHSGGETAVETASGTHILSRISSALLADTAAAAAMGLAGLVGLATPESVVGAVLVTAVVAVRILPAVLFPRK